MREITVSGVYTPHVKQTAFGDNFFEDLLQIGGEDIIIVGDFNAVFDNMIDRSRKSSTPGFPTNFYSYFEMFHLIDSGILNIKMSVITPFFQHITLPIQGST